MKKSRRGALVAAAGILLLLGGAGTLAFWTDSRPITGGPGNSGHLRIVTDATNAATLTATQVHA